MKKDARLTFRVRSDLKKDIEEIANRERHSVAKICEAFLLAGSDAYKKQGTRVVKRALARLITKSSTDWFPSTPATIPISLRLFKAGIWLAWITANAAYNLNQRSTAHFA
jgi:hypothetical protein